jgi:hypothetical protein
MALCLALSLLPTFDDDNSTIQRRCLASGSGSSGGYSTTFLHKAKAETVQKNWLSDPSTYPLILTMGVAGALVSVVAGSCILYNPDVQINPKRRGAVLRTWEF